MKIKLFFIILTFFFNVKILAQSSNILSEVKRAMDSSTVFDTYKIKQINDLKNSLSSLKPDQLHSRFSLCQELFNQYKIFKSDSAYYYSTRSKDIAQQLNDSSLIYISYLNSADICISVGMYREALEYLEAIKPDSISSGTKFMYYGLYGRCYGDLSEYSNLPDFNKEYNAKARFYREQTLKLTEEGSFFNLFMQAFNEYQANNFDEALIHLNDLAKQDLGLRDMALTNYILGEIYYKKKQLDLAEYHYAYAAIADIKTSTKESLAIIKLSELLFQKRELEMASELIQKANDDALFYGAQQRKLQVGAVLPLIEEEIVKNIEMEKKRLYWQYIGAIIFLLILVIFSSIVVFQFKRLQKARKVISKAHNQLKATNAQLVLVNEELKIRNQEIVKGNSKLSEANKIKEEYLGLFFTEYDNIFEKFNDLVNETKDDLISEDYKKAIFKLSKYDLKKEKQKLLQNFDTAFINLFPSFIDEFNSLMEEGNEIKFKKDQILNKELRIFALIRLGIKHNDKIAQILGYSVNSIYAYKSSIRNKSKVKNESFDQNLIANTTIKV